MAVVSFDAVDVVFGRDPAAALALLDEGVGKDEISARTGQIVGVTGATLAIDEGEIFVLMGLSGSGKSSLLRCVNGLNRVARGRVLVRDGESEVDIAHCEAGRLRRLRMNRISMVFQQFALMPWRSVRDNVGYGLEIRGVAKDERYARVAQVLELVHLAQWADKYPHELSGGMQQRVGLARAFVTEAPILLMDEPFSALDPLIREHLQEELLEFQRRLKRTILFVSHDLDEALKIGSRIAIMEGGRIVQVGQPEEIITRPSTDYVRAFVANVNPLNVLRAGSLMCPAAELERDAAGIVLLDRGGRLTCRLDGEGRIAGVFAAARPLATVAYAGTLEATSLGEGTVATASPETPMRAIIELIYAADRAVPIVDGEGRLVGVVGMHELLAGLARRGAAPAAEAVAAAGC